MAIVTACGAASSERGQKPSAKTSETTPPAPNQPATSNKPQLGLVLNDPSFSFETRPSGASCYGLFVSESRFLAPAHCFDDPSPGRHVALASGSSPFMATFSSLLKAPSNEVEGVVLLAADPDALRSTQSFDPTLFELPDRIHPPFPLTMNAGFTADPLVCSPLRYNTGGLVAYDCPTSGAMSGAVLKSKDSKPFAIHLGRKSGLGYALVLGSIKNEIVGVLEKSGKPTLKEPK
jgi:hypothetical protein